MNKIYDNEGWPTKDGLRLIARIVNGVVSDYTAPYIVLKRARNQMAGLEFDDGWRLDSDGPRHTPEHLEAWRLAVGSFYAKFTEGGGGSPESEAENREYAELWLDALQKHMDAMSQAMLKVQK